MAQGRGGGGFQAGDVTVELDGRRVESADRAMDPQNHGFMYGWSFYDPDGHHWEVLWMDPKGMPEHQVKS